MKALIFENKVVEIASEEFEVHESMTWMDCPDECEGNWTLENNTLIAPVPMEPRSYDSNRRNEYPSIGDQLDTLFHAGLFPAEMASEIQAIKDKYPKPTE